MCVWGCVCMCVCANMVLCRYTSQLWKQFLFKQYPYLDSVLVLAQFCENGPWSLWPLLLTCLPHLNQKNPLQEHTSSSNISSSLFHSGVAGCSERCMSLESNRFTFHFWLYRILPFGVVGILRWTQEAIFFTVTDTEKWARNVSLLFIPSPYGLTCRG